jgi:hypothetical protein
MNPDNRDDFIFAFVFMLYKTNTPIYVVYVAPSGDVFTKC